MASAGHRWDRLAARWEAGVSRVVDPLSTDPRDRAGRLASLLYALGVTGVLLSGLAGAGAAGRGAAAATAVAAGTAGVVFALLPWRRLPPVAALAPPLVGQLLIAGGIAAGGGSPAELLPFTVLCGVYLGLTGRPGVPLLVAPALTAAGLLTVLHPGDAPVVVPLLATVVVATAVGELVAATTRRDARLSSTLDGLLTHLAGLSRSATPEEACARTARVAAGLLDADAVAVLLPDPERPGRWQAPGPAGDHLAAADLTAAAVLEGDLGVAALGAALRSSGLVLLPGTPSLAAAPLPGPHGPVGVLLALWHRPVGRLDDVARRGADVLAGEAGELLARLEQERLLRDAATTDPLSGLPNRRVLVEAVDAMVPGDAVVLLDLDHFKRLNDVEGHAVGDREIARFGQALRLLVRDRDTAARYGGEEFTLVLPGAGLAGAVAMVERLQRQWRAVARTTFSAGVAEHRPDRAPAATLAAADAALYRAKDAGRDTWASEPVPPVDGPADAPPPPYRGAQEALLDAGPSPARRRSADRTGALSSRQGSVVR